MAEIEATNTVDFTPDELNRCLGNGFTYHRESNTLYIRGARVLPAFERAGGRKQGQQWSTTQFIDRSCALSGTEQWCGWRSPDRRHADVKSEGDRWWAGNNYDHQAGARNAFQLCARIHFGFKFQWVYQRCPNERHLVAALWERCD
jgi:hypothetical protein